ncbi:hypothetical protein G6514_001953 [Epicoccum nigrum]|nr:hypothetical protein G6514_001953 [Epicoccum nigrum]
MRSTTVIALFAGSVAAQSSAVVVNPIMPAATLTVVGSSEGTTTYVNSCSDAGIPASYLPSGAAAASSSAVRSVPSAIELTPIAAPTPTAAARLRRQENGLFGGFCEPVTIKQGASSVQIHLEDPTKGVWTADMNCAWKGDVTTADLTCTATQSGSYAKLQEVEGIKVDDIKAGDVAAGKMVQTVAVVGPASNSAAPTATGSGAHNATSASGSAAPTATGNAAAGGPLPKGVMAFVGGAAGVFAAALAL